MEGEQRPRHSVDSERGGSCVDGWDGRFMHKINRYHESIGDKDGSLESVTSQFLSPTFDDFMRDYYGKRPVLVKTNVLLDWTVHQSQTSPKDINVQLPKILPQNWVGRTAHTAAVIASGKLKGRVAVVDPGDKERKRANPEYEAALEKAAQAQSAQERLKVLAAELHHLSERYLVAVRDPHTDNSAVAYLRRKFERLFRCCVTTNLYLSGDAGSIGFVEHHDTHDVFAIQLHGAKKWYVGPPIMNFPSARFLQLDDHTSDEDHMDIFETAVGSMLYIPAGWRHYAVPAPQKDGQKCESVHVTMGIQVPRWMDVLETAIQSLGADVEWLRQPLRAEAVSSEGGQVSIHWDASQLSSKLNHASDALKARTTPFETLQTHLGAIVDVAYNPRKASTATPQMLL